MVDLVELNTSEQRRLLTTKEVSARELRAARALEEATAHGRRRPDIVTLAAAGPAGFEPPSNQPVTA